MLRGVGWGRGEGGVIVRAREGGGMRTLPIIAELGSSLALDQRTKLIRESVQFSSSQSVQFG